MQRHWNIQYSVTDTLYIFLVTCDQYQYNFSRPVLFRIIPFIRIEWLQDFFNLTGGHFLCCIRALEVWSAEFCTAFVDTKISILRLFFILRFDKSLLFALNIIWTWSLYIFVRACSSFIVSVLIPQTVLLRWRVQLFCWYPI